MVVNKEQRSDNKNDEIYTSHRPGREVEAADDFFCLSNKNEGSDKQGKRGRGEDVRGSIGNYASQHIDEETLTEVEETNQLLMDLYLDNTGDVVATTSSSNFAMKEVVILSRG